MPQSARIRRRHSSNYQGKGTKKRPVQSKKRKKDYAVEEATEEVELFRVEKIVDRKLDKNGVALYKTRWKGYSASDDTWEPRENVASTGHIDRYERQQRQKTLKRSTAGVAVIEYEDGEREMVDLKIEKFRGYRPDSSDEERDDDTVNGDDDVNNFTLVRESEWIEILWHHTVIYFPCKVISWTPLHKSKKSASKSLRKGVFEDVEESPQSKQKERKSSSKRAKRGSIATVPDKKRPEAIDPTRSSESDSVLEEPTQQMFWKNDESMHKQGIFEEDQSESDYSSEYQSDSDDSCEDMPVERVGHGIPLFDEPEDDFDDDGSDDDVEEEEEMCTKPSQRSSHNDKPKLSFEELWTLKLKRTQELIGQGL